MLMQRTIFGGCSVGRCTHDDKPCSRSPTSRSEDHAKQASAGMMFGGILNVVLDPNRSCFF